MVKRRYRDAPADPVLRDYLCSIPEPANTSAVDGNLQSLSSRPLALSVSAWVCVKVSGVDSTLPVRCQPKTFLARAWALLAALSVVEVGVHGIPAHDAPSVVMMRQAPQQKPAIRAIGPPQPEFHVARLAGVDGHLQRRDDARQIIAVDGVGRRPGFQFIERPREIGRDLIVDEFDLSGVHQPTHKGGTAIDDASKTPVVCRQEIVRRVLLVVPLRAISDGAPIGGHLRIIVRRHQSTRGPTGADITTRRNLLRCAAAPS